MTDEAMNPLRRRMIEDMTIRKLSPKTQQGYIRTIKNLAVFLGRSPDTASFEDIRCFRWCGATSRGGRATGSSSRARRHRRSVERRKKIGVNDGYG